MNLKSKQRSDPVERVIEGALNFHGIYHINPELTKEHPNLDFYLPDLNLYIECKRFYTDRVINQVKDLENVIIIQGLKAAEQFAALLFKVA